MRSFAFFSSLILAITGALEAKGWEATSFSGPVRSTVIPSVRFIQPRAPVSQRASAETFRRKTLSYPSTDGINLGEGWDFLTNQKTLSSCIIMQPTSDTKYKNATVRVREASDEETLKMTLNVELFGSFGGTFEIVKAKADATSTLNASRFVATTDISFVAHATIENGINFAAPPTNASSIALKPDMARLAKVNPRQFREKCGDGFVASIGYGSDLYLLFNFHTLTRDDRLELAFDSKASAGFGDVFSASGSSKLRSTIERLVKASALDISFIQRGGKIETIPLTLEESRKVVQDLGKEATQAPRAVFMVLIPYAELPDWEGFFWLDASTPKERAMRYFLRLSSINSEILNIREDFYRDRDDSKSPIYDKYYYRYAHQLREENLSQVSKALWDEIAIVDDLLRLLDSPKCNPNPVSASYGHGLLGNQRRAAERAWNQQRADLETKARDCDTEAEELIKKTDNFNDFRFWIALPIPLNSLSATRWEAISNLSNPLAQRRDKFAHAVFDHWVERIDQLRCRLFMECLTIQDRESLFKTVLSTVSGFPVTVEQISMGMCVGELAGQCGGRRHFACYTDESANARQMCEEKRGFRNIRQNRTTRGGNQCGYAELDVICYKYQPLHPQ
jgi:hypothetical protein